MRDLNPRVTQDFQRAFWNQFSFTELKNLRCFYCGVRCPNTGTIDHKLPSSRGGSNSMKNLVVACRPCNNMKAAMTVEEFRYFWLCHLQHSYMLSVSNRPQPRIKLKGLRFFGERTNQAAINLYGRPLS